MAEAVSPDPEHLLGLARDGNTEALGLLLGLYRHYLALLARIQIGARLQRKVDASDLVQEAFLEAHRDFAAFRGSSEAELVGWLRQILASNLARQVRRYAGAQRRDIRLERELEGELHRSSCVLDRGLLTTRSSPSRRAARREQAVLLANALAQLPEHYREVIVLRHLEGLTFPEVARRMERTVDSVRKLWARALAQLRDSFGAAP